MMYDIGWIEKNIPDANVEISNSDIRKARTGSMNQNIKFAIIPPIEAKKNLLDQINLQNDTLDLFCFCMIII